MKLKLKYYLRGLGLGIVVTAVIMCIMESKDNKMTDEEIIARAKQLGLIESTVLIESSPKEDDDVQGTDNNQEEDISESGDAEGQSQTDGSVTGSEVQANANANVSDSGVQLNVSSLLPDAWTGISTENQDTQNDEDATEDSTQSTQSGTDATEDNKRDTQSDADITEAGEQDTTETTPVFPKVLIISNGESSYTVSKKLAEIGAVESASDFDTYLCEHGYDKKIRAGTYTIPVGATDEQMAKIVTGVKVTE